MTLWKWMHFTPAKNILSSSLQHKVNSVFVRMLRSDGNKEHQVQSGRTATIYRLFHALPESSVVGQGKHTAFNPCCPYQPQKGEIWKCEGNSQLCELQDIPMAHLRWFESKVPFWWDCKRVTKEFHCFLCECDCHAKSSYYTKKNQPLCKSHSPETKNVAHQPLVDPCCFYLSTLNWAWWPFREGIREKWPSIPILVWEIPKA